MHRRLAFFNSFKMPRLFGGAAPAQALTASRNRATQGECNEAAARVTSALRSAVAPRTLQGTVSFPFDFVQRQTTFLHETLAELANGALVGSALGVREAELRTLYPYSGWFYSNHELSTLGSAVRSLTHLLALVEKTLPPSQRDFDVHFRAPEEFYSLPNLDTLISDSLGTILFLLRTCPEVLGERVALDFNAVVNRLERDRPVYPGCNHNRKPLPRL